MCQVLENRSKLDEERMDQLTNQLKEARMLAEDADSKSEEVSRSEPSHLALAISGVKPADNWLLLAYQLLHWLTGGFRWFNDGF